MKIRLSGIVNDSITDGPGLRLAVFAQGCGHGCPGCHNPGSHSLTGGYEEDTERIAELAGENPLISGVTFTGGEPFLQAEAFCEAARRIREGLPHLTIITYTGYTWEELEKIPGAEGLVRLSDYIVDGRFVMGERSLDLMYMGSRNQRFIDVGKTLEKGTVTSLELQVER